MLMLSTIILYYLPETLEGPLELIHPHITTGVIRKKVEPINIDKNGTNVDDHTPLTEGIVMKRV